MVSSVLDRTLRPAQGTAQGQFPQIVHTAWHRVCGWKRCRVLLNSSLKTGFAPAHGSGPLIA